MRAIFVSIAALLAFISIASLALWVRSFSYEDSYYASAWAVGSTGGVIILQLHAPAMAGRGFDSEHVDTLSSDVWFRIRPAWNQNVINIPGIYLPVVSGVLALGMMRGLRTIRRATGSCPRCGYDLHGTPERCPECGFKPTAGFTAPAPAGHR